MRSATYAMAAWMAAVLGLACPARAGESAEAYVRRMAQAGTPEKAESQAGEVLEVDLAEPVSTAVLAAIRARRGDAEGAISGIATAVLFGADEPYVRRTAGQILAWHDTRSGTMADDIESSLESMRATVGDTPECADAYEAARQAYVAARSGTPVTAGSGATLVDDGVEAEFAGDEDGDAVIYTLSVASSCVSWNHVSPSCGAAWCSAVVRACSPRAFDAGRAGTRFAAQRTYWGRGGASYAAPGRASASWSTPLGTFSGSVRTSAYCAPAASAPSCAPPAGCEPQHDGRRR